MNALVNRQWRVAAYPAPEEIPRTTHFQWREEPAPEPGPDEFLVRTICLAPGPAQRGYLLPGSSELFPPVELGEVMRGRGVGQIVQSRHPDYAEGEVFVGSLGWQDYSVQRPRGAEFVFSTSRIDQPAQPLSLELGLLGQAGATAYFGLTQAAAIQAGDSVLVSAAAGGVGSMAGQLARIMGARKVVGLAGGPEKCAWLVNELGYHAAIDYRSHDLDEQLAAAFPEGIDVFFDNVGGEILNTALDRLAMGARVALCGFIATNYLKDPACGPINYRRLVEKRARMQGFIVFDFWEQFPATREKLLAWYNAGELLNCQDEAQGLEQMPDCLASLFTGGNCGIKLCRVAPD
ncbi:MAG: NADP-dependent oxidoreductase [Gammaproteobacteria bacterium]